MPRTLFVKKVTGVLINVKWGVNSNIPNEIYYARCNKEGIINWDKTLIYKAHQLVGRDKVRVMP